MYEVFEKLLAAKGVTVAEVSRSTGIKQSTLSNWKKRRNKLSSENAKKIAAYFGITIDELMGVQQDAQDKAYFKDAATAIEAQQMFEDKRIRGLNHIRKNTESEKFSTYYEMLVSLYRMENPQDDYDFGE